MRPRGHHLFSGVAPAEVFPRPSVLLMRVMGIRLGLREGHVSLSVQDCWPRALVEAFRMDGTRR